MFYTQLKIILLCQKLSTFSNFCLFFIYSLHITVRLDSGFGYCLRKIVTSVNVCVFDRPGIITLQAFSESNRKLWLEAMDGKEPVRIFFNFLFILQFSGSHIKERSQYTCQIFCCNTNKHSSFLCETLMQVPSEDKYKVEKKIYYFKPMFIYHYFMLGYFK